MNKKRWISIVIILFLGISILILAIYFKFVKYDIKNNLSENENVVATRLTTDSYKRGPIEFNDEVYFPSSYDFSEADNTAELGRLAFKNDTALLKITSKQVVIADKTDENFTHLKVRGDDTTNFTRADKLEDAELFKANYVKYNKFILIHDEGSESIRYSLNKELLLQLENEFGQVRYNANDFKNSSVYYIYVDSPTNKIFGAGSISVYDDPIIYIGCILNENNELYYGNTNNKITGKLLNEIEGILGD